MEPAGERWATEGAEPRGSGLGNEAGAGVLKVKDHGWVGLKKAGNKACQ